MEMESNHGSLLKRIADTKEGLSHLIDFNILENLADVDHPNFVEDVLGVFLQDLPTLITHLRRSSDVNERTEILNKIKSMSNRIGAVQIRMGADQLSERLCYQKSSKSWNFHMNFFEDDYYLFKNGIMDYLEDLKRVKHSNLRVSTPLHEQIDIRRQSFIDKGVLGQKFLEVENLKDKDGNEDFLAETLAVFFEHSGELITSIEKKLDRTTTNYGQLLHMLDQVKGNSASNGVLKIENAANEMKKLCREQSLDSAKKSFEQLKADYASFEKEFKLFLKLLRIAEYVSKIRQEISRDSPKEWLNFTH